MRPTLTLLFALFITFAYGQDILFDKPLTLKRGFKDNREAYPVVNDSTGNVTMFLFDKTTIQAISFDKDYNVINEVEGPRPESSYDEILGCSISKGVYTIYFSTSNHKNFAATNFNFETKRVWLTMLKFPFKKDERYIGSINYSGTFYFITAMDPDIIKIHAMTDPKESKWRESSFPKQKFSSKSTGTLYDVLTEKDAISIDNEVPTPLDVATRKTKLYAYDDKIVLTLDQYEFRTAIIKFDSKTLEGTVSFINQSSIYCGEYGKPQHNSYIYDRHLYQIKVCGFQMIVNIIDLDKGEILNKLIVKKDEDFSITNSPVIQKGGFYDDERELSRPSQFLRKVSASNAGMSAVRTPNGIELTIGGSKEVQGGAPGFGGGMTPGTTISTPYGSVTTAPVYNPTFYGYNSYKGSISVYFKSLIDPETYQHKTGEVKDNAFDKIQKFTKDIEKKITAETIFKKDGAYILGYYFKPEDKYVLRKFAD
jgi:hypothetical protein